ncbi:MAG: hypothetical protein KDD98_10560 [Sphingomonadaceae bacterium]|nr:hypothetical protein [Sphingomonadaceae bacterium]
MLHKFFEPGAWFAPKRYGYGAGWPIAWQGWALLGSYLAVLAGVGQLASFEPETGPAIAFAVIIPATAVLIIAAKRRTRGEWRWRWGEGD